MMQTPEGFLRRLRSDNNKERLEAARYFAEHAIASNDTVLREALAKESVPWIRGALRRALAKLSPNDDGSPVWSVDRDDLPEGFAQQVYSEALETTTAQLMHEIEPLLGSVRLAAEREVPSFDTSDTRRSLDRMDELLEALSRLRRAASAPKIEEFQLDELVQRLIQDVPDTAGITIHKSGPQPCVVHGDESLITLCVANGLRNAVEATVAVGGDLSRVPVNIMWGTTDVDHWVSILDVGIGFRGNVQRAFEIGATTKQGHLGMGLAIASQSVASMNGKVLLIPNERGVRFEMRWPKPAS
jgi:signal transduction histidine kinase